MLTARARGDVLVRHQQAVFVAMVIAACGGGGGGDRDGTSTPPDVTLDASPATVDAGGVTTLTWTSSPGTTSCSATDGWSGVRETSGSAESPQIYFTTQFGIRCVNEAGGRTALTTVNVRPPQMTFTATPEVLQRGEKVTLRWETRGIDFCYAEWKHPYERPANGSEVVDLADLGQDLLRVTLTLRCYGGGQSLERSARVRVKAFMGDVLFPGVFVDADINDPNAPLYQNDTLEDANKLSGAHVGYVNVPGEGPPGRSFATGDVSDFSNTDFFDTGELAGVRLVMPGVDMSRPAQERADADLYAYDSSGNLLDASVGTGQVEAVDLPGGDNYYFEVRAVRGGLNYMLELVRPPATLGMHGRRVNARFLPDEALVVPEVAGRGALAPEAGARLTLRKLALEPKAGAPARGVRVSLPARGVPSPPGTRMTLEQRRRLSTLLQVKSLAAAPGIRAASTNRMVDALATAPADPFYLRQSWHYELISLPSAWDITTGAAGIAIAVVDSGVARPHPDLEPRLANGYDMVSDPANLDNDGIDPDFDDPGSPGSVFHGTHVAGTVGAVSNDNRGVSGVTWSSSVMPIRVLNSGSGTMYDVIQGVRYAAGLDNDSGTMPPKAADVINLSLGASGDCEPFEAETFAEVRAAGVMVVASAGNSASNFPSTPASCPGVLSVASVGATGELAGYSNYGQFVEVAAPGGDFRFDGDGDGDPDGVYSTHASSTLSDRSFGYEWLQGTSMAAPHVADVLALMRSVNPALQPADVDQLLAAGALTDDVLAPGRDDAGYGIINAFKAVRAATGDFDNTPRLVATPSLLIYHGGGRAGLRLSNEGSGVLRVISAEASAPWLAVTPNDVDANGLGLYTVDVYGDQIPFGGQLTGSVVVQTNSGTRYVPVIASDGGGFTSTNIPLYVEVTDADTGELVRRVRATDARPNAYRFDDLPPGRYFVIAGTDLDNDGFVCGPGEVCGAHPAYRYSQAVDYVDTSDGINVPLVVTAKQFVPTP
jgi:serine protease